MRDKKLIFPLAIILFLILSIILIIIFFRYKFIPNLKIISNPLNTKEINLYSENVFIQKEKWSISIPKLNLENLPIKEDTSQDTLENYIGHFSSSSYFKGNVCLAAHNAGYQVNYFSSIYTLSPGDNIIYNYRDNIKIYEVTRKYEIDENDFDILNLDKKDKLTLLTCISNSPSKRLCIEAICKEE